MQFNMQWCSWLRHLATSKKVVDLICGRGVSFGFSIDVFLPDALTLGLTAFNPLNAELNPICHLQALLGAHHILHISRIRVNRNEGVMAAGGWG